MKITMTLEIDGRVDDPDELEELRDEMQSAASGVLCDIRHGDSGNVRLVFHSGGPDPLIRKHMQHASQCPCLDDSAECCIPSCECHSGGRP